MLLKYNPPTSNTQRLEEIQRLFKGLKCGMTLKCPTLLRFLIVHQFYVPPVTLFEATIPSLFLSSSSRKFLFPLLDTAKNITEDNDFVIICNLWWFPGKYLLLYVSETWLMWCCLHRWRCWENLGYYIRTIGCRSIHVLCDAKGYNLKKDYLLPTEQNKHHCT